MSPIWRQVGLRLVAASRLTVRPRLSNRQPPQELSLLYDAFLQYGYSTVAAGCLVLAEWTAKSATAAPPTAAPATPVNGPTAATANHHAYASAAHTAQRDQPLCDASPAGVSPAGVSRGNGDAEAMDTAVGGGRGALGSGVSGIARNRPARFASSGLDSVPTAAG